MNDTHMNRTVALSVEDLSGLVGTLATAASLLRALGKETTLLNPEPTAAKCARASADLYRALQGAKP